uniref:Putative secreted protein n=1 Tax=Ixodes scapularis TaxID=6945 RepID=A0A4D5RWB4_IXOSC
MIFFTHFIFFLLCLPTSFDTLLWSPPLPSHQETKTTTLRWSILYIYTYTRYKTGRKEPFSLLFHVSWK